MATITMDPFLTEPDTIVLKNLLDDVKKSSIAGDVASTDKSSDPARRSEEKISEQDEADISRLKAFNDPSHPDFTPTVFTFCDDKDIPEPIKQWLIRPYTRFAMTVVRHPTDVVFLTNILMYTFINLPSAVLLFRHFTYLHGIAHLAFSFWCVGPFTLMLHNHIHNNGVLSKALPWSVVDFVFPYIFEPLIGHTWDSYYYHHVKHHHVEGNGPDDLSSTVRYQRDSILGFAHYVGRFLFLIWYDLPVYFLRKNKPGLALRCLVSELANYAFIAFMTVRVNPRAGTFVLVLPFTILRLGLMIGNWGQHALVDEQEPDSDFRSSITLIDVPSNRFCFNDGYHTAHHLNPRRHWREQPVHFLQSKAKYTAGRALVFTNIDYLMLTVTLLRKDYAHLAKCFVPIGEAQIELARTPGAVESMLRSKTRKFSEEELRGKFPGVYAAEGKADSSRDGSVGWRAGLSRLAHWLDGARLRAESLPLGAATLEAVPAGHKKAE